MNPAGSGRMASRLCGVLATLVVLAVVAACTPTVTVDVATFGPVRPAYSGEIQVFTDPGRIPGEYIEIGRIVIEAYDAAQQDILDRGRAEAASVGANAVVFFDQEDVMGAVPLVQYIAGSPVVTSMSYSYTRFVFLAIWIP